MGKWSFAPAVIGFWLGILFLLLLDHVIPHLHRYPDQEEEPKGRLTRSTMRVLAVTLHNIPERAEQGAPKRTAMRSSNTMLQLSRTM